MFRWWCLLHVALEQLSCWPYRAGLPGKALLLRTASKEKKVSFPRYRCQTPTATRRWKERGSTSRCGASPALLTEICACPGKLKKRRSACNQWLDKECYWNLCVIFYINALLEHYREIKSWGFWLVFKILIFHRIIESPRLEKTSKIIHSNCPPVTNISHWTTFPQYNINAFHDFPAESKKTLSTSLSWWTR